MAADMITTMVAPDDLIDHNVGLFILLEHFI